MKTALLGSTALLGAALVAGPAMAQLEVTIGGSVKFSAGYVDDDFRIFDNGVDVTDEVFGDAAAADPPVPTDRENWDIQSEADIQVRADGVADNGLRYGALVDLQTSTSDSSHVDETMIYLSGGWGRLEFGDDDGAADSMGFVSPGGAGAGGVWGDWTDWGGWDYGPAQKPIDSSDSTKITYYTPRFGGFQVGVSYAPFSDSGESIVHFEDTASFEDWIEAGANYVGNFGNVSVGIAATYTMADAGAGNTVTDFTDPLLPDVQAEDVQAWSVSGEVGFGGFTFGALYVDQGDSASYGGVDSSAWGVGATYGQGPWEVGINYVSADFDGRQVSWIPWSDAGGPGTPTDDAWAIGAGGSYTLAPGLALMTDFVWFNAETPTFEISDPAVGSAEISVEDEGWVWTTGLRAAF